MFSRNTMIRKFLVAFFSLFTFLLSGCGGNKAPDNKDLEDPRAIAITDDDVFYYGDTREEVEEMIGTESSKAMASMHYYRNYGDSIKIIYREADNKELVVYALIKDKKYRTYQGISVGDNWENIKDKLGEFGEVAYVRSILFDGEEQVDPYTKPEDRGNDWICISYFLDDNGVIETILVCDQLAATILK